MTSPFAPADFEAFSTIETRRFLRPRALFYRTDCTRRSKFLMHALVVYHETKPIWIRVKDKCFEIKVYLWSPNDWSEKLNLYNWISILNNIYDYHSNVLFLSWKHHNRPKVMCPKSSQQISKLGYEVETWSYALEWKMSVPLRAFYRRRAKVIIH